MLSRLTYSSSRTHSVRNWAICHPTSSIERFETHSYEARILIGPKAVAGAAGLTEEIKQRLIAEAKAR